MLADIHLVYPVLMAVFATLFFCLVIDRSIKEWKMTVAAFLCSAISALCYVMFGDVLLTDYTPQKVLIHYSFGCAGLAVGLLPSRKLFREWGEEWRRGVRREEYEYPSRYSLYAVSAITVMVTLGIFLTS